MGAVVKGNSSDRQRPAWIVRRDHKRAQTADVEAKAGAPRKHRAQTGFFAGLSREELVAHVDGILAGTVQVDMWDVLQTSDTEPAPHASGHPTAPPPDE